MNVCKLAEILGGGAIDGATGSTHGSCKRLADGRLRPTARKPERATDRWAEIEILEADTR